MSTNDSQSPYSNNGGRQRQYDVEPWRKWAYYGGIALQVVGFIAFASVFLTFFTSFNSTFGNPDAFDTHFDRTLKVFPLAFVGILLMIGGQMLQKIGRKGLAGSGVILSPQGEVRDAEPWSRAQGAKDQQRLEEVPALGRLGAGAESQIRVRCRSCGYLETEDATFCSSCGARM
ncbi:MULTISPECIES: zinc ribbon domain-containing protein [Actinomyces]|uniref:Zinc ribbon domain-containing protein n=1 Tax=Actinomyces respiraculi TaxID=2744574 RepID=A0A7T0LKQ8_9ACTO|nr:MULTISPECIES: zinc ribbon domain-containing protein [Actinomyces]QPL05417.1 zinc ribbon domain-containing protein [Actinomyces respiraculi]